ncbi:hypothetical protein [Candidatus Poriferisodalis sp.]|uniref:hypothetical protein n=1 Tax=Candidatus Poriferisodalis sp. TaxID=3101277 RepID=UPI003B02E98D
MTPAFPLPISEMFRRGIVGYAKNVVPLTAAAAATFAVYGVFRAAASTRHSAVGAIVLDLVGLMLAGTVSLPWFAYALDAARARPVNMLGPLRNGGSFVAQLVCSFWFWAAVLLGARYLFGIPSLIAALFYGFYGYVVADRAAKGGLSALGTSVRLGTKRRVALFAIMTLFIVFNFLAAIPLGYGVTALTVAGTVAAGLVTSSITVVAWACLYDALRDCLGEQ